MKKDIKKAALQSKSKTVSKQPVALILAGYNKPSSRLKRILHRSMKESYGAGELYAGKNKFLLPLAGKPLITYVMDAVCGARKSGRPLYKKIFLYNDISSFSSMIDGDAYPRVQLCQMTDSVAGHLNDFYQQIDYGQRVDIFFGDTPRITSRDVENMHHAGAIILNRRSSAKQKKPVLLFSLAEYADIKDDNWLLRRIRYVRRGPNKGKLKSFINFEHADVRVGNFAACIKDPALDPIVKCGMIDYAYSLRKAMHPGTLSKILYYMWKTRHTDLIRQIKTRSISEAKLIPALCDIFSKVYKTHLSSGSMQFIHIKKNAARWENDIDGPADYKIFKDKLQ